MAKVDEKPNLDDIDDKKREILSITPDCEKILNCRIQKMEYNNKIMNNDLHKVQKPEIKKLIQDNIEKSKKKIAYYKQQAEGCDDPNPH